MPTSDSLSEMFDSRDHRATGPETAAPGPVGTPLSVGPRARLPQSDPRQFSAIASVPARTPTPAQAPVAPAPESRTSDDLRAHPDTDPTLQQNLQKAMGAFRVAAPFVQRLMPLLNGDVAAAVSHLLAPALAQPAAAAQPAPVSLATPPPAAQISAQPVDLAPLEQGMRRIDASQRELRIQLAEQNTSVQRVGDQLEMVREATDRNTLEQQELMEDLKAIGKKVNLVTLVVLAMLLGSLLLNLILYLHIQRVLP